MLLYRVSQRLFEAPDVFSPIATAEGAVPFLASILSDPSSPELICQPALSVVINILFNSPELIPDFRGVFEILYRRMMDGDNQDFQRFIALFFSNSMVDSDELRRAFVEWGFYDELMGELKSGDRPAGFVKAMSRLIPTFALPGFPVTTEQRYTLFCVLPLLIQWELFKVFLDAVCVLLEIDDALVRKWFFSDYDFFGPVAQLIGKEDLDEALTAQALCTCSQILRVAPHIFSLSRVPIGRIVRLAMQVDSPAVSIEAHRVLNEYLSLGHADAVSDLSEHKYVSFVIDGPLDNLPFGVRKVAADVCWKALQVAATTQFEALLKMGLVSQLIGELQASDARAIKAFLAVASRAGHHGWLGVLTSEWEAIEYLWECIDEADTELRTALESLLTCLETMGTGEEPDECD
jgi:hypothetical protein